MDSKRPRPTTPEEEGIELYPDVMERLERAVKTAARHGPIPADDPALQDREVVFRRVGVPEVGANVFLGAMVDAAVTGKLRGDTRIDRAVIGHDVSRLVDLPGNDRADRRAIDVRDMARAHR